MPGDDVIGSVTGTATFKHVSIYREENGLVRVTGTYSDNSATTYEAPPGSVSVEGIEITVGDTEAVTLTPKNEESWIIIEATETELLISLD